MLKIIDAIDHALQRDGATYVHCWGGVGRTGLAVACWLQEQGRTRDAALSELAEKWRTVAKCSEKPNSPETAEQVRWIREWPRYRLS
jgi:protein-tyrosine phosphatase